MNLIKTLKKYTGFDFSKNFDNGLSDRQEKRIIKKRVRETVREEKRRKGIKCI